MKSEPLDPPIRLDEEIGCLLGAGWQWDGDKLVHPTHPNIWREYQRVDCRSIIARNDQFEQEINEGVLNARRRAAGS